MYSLNEKIIIWLDVFEFLTVEKRHQILACYEEPRLIFDTFKNDYEMFSNVLTLEQFNKMSSSLNLEFIENHIVNLEREDIKILTYMTQGYPKDFVNYYGFPLVLYCKGDVSLIDTISVGVVGTRKISRYGHDATKKLVQGLVDNNITVVSGMANGVDTVAHTTALEMGGKTIAVIGSGFHEIYPKSNFELFNRIVEKGLVITEYLPSMPALPQNFPVRNRIIAMLSKGVLMTEAGLKSGAHYTINYAIEYGKEIFVVPGNIDSYSSQGCNQVLKKFNSSLTTCVEDILNVLQIENHSQKQTLSYQISMEEQQVLNAIGDNEVSFDEIVSQTKYDTKTCVRLLTTLELNGLIKKSMGNFYSKVVID
ncbi:MAG: DNA-processing protein DprA [Clostridiales bacterium]|nr:DNA-processing protein DprA [Candidatus Apopatousia equi]